MSGVCAVAVGALAGLIGLKVSFAAPPRAPKKRQPRNGVTERERPRCFCEPLGAEPMSIRSRLPRASVSKGPPGISFHSSEAADHLNCTRVSTGHWCGTGLKKAHLTVRVSLARLFQQHSQKNPHSRLKSAKSLFHPFRTGPAVCAGCPRRVTVTPTSSGSLTHRPVSPLHPASTRARVQLTRASPNRR